MIRIPLGNNAYCVADKRDELLLSAYRWRLNTYRVDAPQYAISNKRILMHRLLMEPPGSMVVDHVNHDTLDNRRRNLRVCTRKQNQHNMSLRRDSKSGFKGVSFYGGPHPWRASIQTCGKTRWLGRFCSAIDAAVAYDVAASELFGSFACLNFPAKHHAFVILEVRA